MNVDRSMPKIEKVPVPKTNLGEGPHWDAEKQCLYYVDLFHGIINQYNPGTGKHVSLKLGHKTVSFIIPVKGTENSFIIGEGLDIKVINWDRENNEITNSKILATIPESLTHNRTNDAKCDSHGRLWIGTMAVNEYLKDYPSNGALYSLSGNRGLKKHLTSIGIGNGLAWSLDDKAMYYVDSFKYNFEEFLFDPQFGCLKCGKLKEFDFSKNCIKGLPDGMCIDSNGNLWIACHGAFQVVNVDPRTQKVIRTLKFEAEQVTSVAFGGPNLDELYVTTGAKYENSCDLSRNPCAGTLYRVTGLGVNGFPGVPFDPES